MKKYFAYLLLLLSIPFLSFSTEIDQQPRTIITTDGEIDDVDTFIRMLLYSNEFHLEGLIYSSSMWHYKGDGKGTVFTSEMEMTKKMYGPKTSLRWPGTRWIEDLIDAYSQVYPNLAQHDKNFPQPSYLSSLVKIGNIDFEGEMEQKTAGSEWIKNKLLDSNPNDLYLQAWGGTNTIARALKSIEEEYKNKSEWLEIKEKISKKAVIYTIMDQDATYKNYIEKAWPSIRVYYNSFQFACFAYPWKKIVPKAFLPYLEGKYMGEKIINKHGALLKKYYSYGDGQKQEGDDEHIHGNAANLKNSQWGNFGKYDFISEGDSPAFLQLVDMGFSNLEHPEYGGWGGRFVQSKTNPFRYEDGPNAADINPETNKPDNYYPQSRWINAIQDDFAARAEWCITNFTNANHAPQIHWLGSPRVEVAAGETKRFNYSVSDPDFHLLSTNVWQYKEVGTGVETLKAFAKLDYIQIAVPAKAKKGEQYHLILEVKDEGRPSLTKYKRIIVTVI